ncbi:MAG: MarR family transcriptional regulator [Oscillospiraceae bacterium]|nr:MarR family transcriptional regulator [Oscillospiraceae bacterium]MDE7172552.1 MarR family transcriptional regulator [Oscillospiraceae bacterium]
MDERPGMVLHQVLRAHHNACTAALAKQGLRDIGSPRLLVELSQYPDDPAQAPTQKELADRLHIAPPTIAASLKCLERQGYVARRTDEKDSRRNRISITRKGRDALDSGMRAFQQVDDAMYRGFTPEEREQVQEFHRRMLDNLYQIGGDREDEHCPPPPPPEPLERKCDPC